MDSRGIVLPVEAHILSAVVAEPWTQARSQRQLRSLRLGSAAQDQQLSVFAHLCLGRPLQTTVAPGSREHRAPAVETFRTAHAAML
jgi:hypothetical protein